MSEVVRRCSAPHGFGVPSKPANPSTSPLRGTHGLKRPVAAQHCPDGPQGGGYPARGKGKGSAGFLPALAPTTRSGPPAVDRFLRPATGAVGSAGGVTGGRPAAQDPQRDSRHVEQGLRAIRRARGLWLRAYDRFASGLRRLPGRPDEGGLSAILLIGREYTLPQVAARPRPWTWPLASPAWRAGTPPSHDKEPSRASERAARPLKSDLVRR